MLASTIALAAVTAPSGPELETLRARARELYQTLAQHMSFEESVLSTALRDVIGWGPALHAQMQEDHEKQRAALASAIAELEPPPRDGKQLADGVRAFANTLLLDMEREERGLLEADVDAIVTGDARGG